jgi:hypothetical protein
MKKVAGHNTKQEREITKLRHLVRLNKSTLGSFSS